MEKSRKVYAQDSVAWKTSAHRIMAIHNRKFTKPIKKEDIQLIRVSQEPTSWIYRDAEDGFVYSITVFPWGEVWYDCLTQMIGTYGKEYVRAVFGYEEEE